MKGIGGKYMALSLNEKTYLKLKNEIMKFKLVPGDVVSAQKLSERYDVSRTPAREAIVRLETEGLLKIIPQSGTYVAKINWERAGQEWFVRMTLELGMAEIFIANCTDEVIDKMRDNLDKLEHFTPDLEGESRIDIDNEFHDIIYDCSKETLAKDIINTQITHYNRIRYLIELNEKVRSKTVLEHKALIDAAEKKNTKEFKALLKKHIRRIIQEQEKLKEMFPEYIE